jgi:hypothetical protein
MDDGFAVYQTIHSVQRDESCDDSNELVIGCRGEGSVGLPGPKFSFPPWTLPFFSSKQNSRYHKENKQLEKNAGNNIQAIYQLSLLNSLC